ncbi:MAG: HEPN domain-containing protein [Nanoarchaeota archaeon]|nr:HEPN domain-containing protein [Nanoarchaeota archaeon]MBU1622799.1 HEPN domain-containing protein [Nanoarchaeota archaeon]MBU1974538.1 HEPN domain-containing protein [Nanoarchaeota archaeon]
MLDTEKIKEAEANVKKYLEDGLIKKTTVDKGIMNTYAKNANESLDVAKLISNNGASNLWVVVASYYAMYYLANAVIYKLGYKIGDKISHKITSDALIVFVRHKLKKSLLEDYEEIKEEALDLVQNKADAIILHYDYEREKRGKFQYDMTEEVKEGKAKTSLARAKEFVNEMKNLLETLP